MWREDSIFSKKGCKGVSCILFIILGFCFISFFCMNTVENITSSGGGVSGSGGGGGNNASVLLELHQQMLMDVYTLAFAAPIDTKAYMYKYQTLLVSLKRIILTCPYASIQQSFFVLLKQLFLLMVYCRDTFGGLGRRDILAPMIFIWNYQFPVPAAKCLHMMVLPIQDNPPFGSWRDMKAICLHIRSYSEKKELDPFLDTCIGMMNHQLDVDNTRWGEALDEYNRKLHTPWEIEKPKPDSVGLSLVARWIPRENSAFGWLFDLCAAQFIRTFRPQYFLYVEGDQGRFQKALRKGKKEYRQILVRLSKTWDTLQIKQCRQDWGAIDPEHIPMGAMISQQHALLNVTVQGKPRRKTLHNKDRDLCASKIQAFWLKHRSNQFVFVPMDRFVKQCLRENGFQGGRLEALWKRVLSQVTIMPYVFPLLDLSLFASHADLFYAYLSMSMVLACKSSLFGLNENRLLCFDSRTHFVDLNNGGADGGADGIGSLRSMVEIMKPVYHQHHIGSDVVHACQVFIECLQKSNLRESDYSKIILVIFSEYTVEKYGSVVSTFESASMSVPQILWTGLSRSVDGGPGVGGAVKYEQFRCHGGAVPLIGTHSHLLVQISQIAPEMWRQMTPYRFLSTLLGNARYLPMEQYINSLKGGG